MLETNDGKTQCGLDRKLVGIRSYWFPLCTRRLFKMRGGQANSNLAPHCMLHKCLQRPAHLAGSWTGVETRPS